MHYIIALFATTICVCLFIGILFLDYKFEEHLQNSFEQTVQKLEHIESKVKDIEHKVTQLKTSWEDEE